MLRQSTSPSDEWTMRLLRGDTTLALDDAVAMVRQGERGVLLQYGRGEYYGLDAVGYAVWEAMRMRVPVPQIVGDIAAQYDVEEEQAAADVAAFIRDLIARGLVHVNA